MTCENEAVPELNAKNETLGDDEIILKKEEFSMFMVIKFEVIKVVPILEFKIWESNRKNDPVVKEKARLLVKLNIELWKVMLNPEDIKKYRGKFEFMKMQFVNIMEPVIEKLNKFKLVEELVLLIKERVSIKTLHPLIFIKRGLV